ncbi:hypothetical protein INT44_003238 [Umbelopsis vinacea]|uniref:Uncharacterized protein n=1 Tax=Umbelopsis vinacea TaxID=44442 RepID=A0A8H7UKZ3_9FUNG|nr:hypothetical protein INT44_003238 [Umbelopsis vinacea]
MEILKDTFEQKLPIVAEAIASCDFLAIDAEFTGTVYMSMQTPTIRNNNCAFQWVYSGISYLTPAEEKKFEQEGLERLNNTIPDIPVDRKEVEFMSDVKEKIDAWLQAKDQKKKGNLEIIALNGYRRRLVYQEVRNNYPQLTAFGKKDCICVGYVNERKEEQRYLEKRMQFDKEKKEAVGFRKVIDLISQSKKPVVGHNVLLDICHMMNQFIAPLPNDVKDFKEMVHRRFPRQQSVIDTKYLAAQAPDLAHFQSTSLENIYFETRLPPFEGPRIEFHWDFPAYQVSKAHEAAYDAYITGYVFLQMANYIHSKTLPAPVVNESPPEQCDEHDEESSAEGFYKFNTKATADTSEVDISNVSWEKKFDNAGSIDMLWGNKEDEVADELNNEPASSHGSANVAKLANVVEEKHQNLLSSSQSPEKDLFELVTALKKSTKIQSHPYETNITSDTPEEEQCHANIIVHFQNDGLLSPYVNKLSLIKSVAEYISLDEPEVLTDHSTVFHIFSKTKTIDEAKLVPIVTQLGNYFMERNGDRSVFVSYTELPKGLTASKADLDSMLEIIGATVETLEEYIQNEATNVGPSTVRERFNS